MDTTMKFGHQPLRIEERGIQAVDGLAIEEVAVHSAKQISIDFGGIKRVVQVVEILSNITRIHELFPRIS